MSGFIMKIAAAQIITTPGAVQDNTKKMLDYIDRSASLGSDVVMFPEMSDTGYDMPLIMSSAQSWDEGTVPALQASAKRYGINVIAGVSERTNEGVFNSTVIINREGSISGRYRKTHLITAEPMLEHRFLKAGESLGIAEVEGVLCGFMTCYDIRFPEIARTLSLKGANILFVPSAFPLVRLTHWTVLLNARAVENQVFVVACNRIGIDAGVSFCGTTTIIDPYGAIIASSSAIHETLVAGEIDLEMIKTVRSQIKVHQDRRPALYQV